MIRSFGRAVPVIHPKAFVHDSAELIGAVTLRSRASVWPLAVLRADVDRIVVGEGSNVQDLAVIHCRERRPTLIGRGVTVGHGVILHGARVGDGCLIGMGATVMEAAVGARSLVAAGSLVLAGMKVPPGSLVMGSPARIVRRLKPAELRGLIDANKAYLVLIDRHRGGSRPVFR